MDDDLYRVVCRADCRNDSLILQRETAERLGRRHHDLTGHPVVVEAVAGGEILRFGERSNGADATSSDSAEGMNS